MLRWLKRLVLLALLLGGLGVVTLTIVSSLAGIRGVQEVAPPATTLLDAVYPGAAYRDAYQVAIPRGSFTQLDELQEAAFRKGALVGRRGTELLYRQRLFGLQLHTDYQVVRTAAGPTILVTTVVHLQGGLDGIRLAIFRPIHRRLMPTLVGRIVNSAVADTEPED